jgi:hypothetical protein
LFVTQNSEEPVAILYGEPATGRRLNELTSDDIDQENGFWSRLLSDRDPDALEELHLRNKRALQQIGFPNGGAPTVIFDGCVFRNNRLKEVNSTSFLSNGVIQAISAFSTLKVIGCKFEDNLYNKFKANVRIFACVSSL